MQAEVVDRSVEGGFAGALATLPMTLLLEAIRRELPRREQHPLEPRLISDNLLDRLGIDNLNDARRSFVASLLHVGYGTAVGAALSNVRMRPTRSRLANGAAVGLAVWAAGYMGWLPLLDVLPPPERRPRGRNTAIIAAHVVWGVCHEFLQRANERMDEFAANR